MSEKEAARFEELRQQINATEPQGAQLYDIHDLRLVFDSQSEELANLREELARKTRHLELMRGQWREQVEYLKNELTKERELHGATMENEAEEWKALDKLVTALNRDLQDGETKISLVTMEALDEARELGAGQPDSEER